MAEEVKGQEAEPTNNGDQGQDIEAKLAELTKLVETQKSEIAGLNRAVSEREAEKKAVEAAAENAAREKMTDIERLTSDMTAMQNDLRVERNTSKVKDYLRENDISSDYVKLINLQSEDIGGQLDIVADLVKRDRAKVAESFAKNNGQSAPKSGKGTPAGKTKRSDFTATEASAYVRENGKDAWDALPK